MITGPPTMAAKGANPVIVGAAEAFTVNAPLEAAPADVTTTIGPVVAPAGTVAVICVGKSTEKLAGTPLNSTSVVPRKLLPVITTVDPTVPLLGVTEAMVGGAAIVTVKLVAELTTPPVVTMVIGPVAAP